MTNLNNSESFSFSLIIGPVAKNDDSIDNIETENYKHGFGKGKINIDVIGN